MVILFSDWLYVVYTWGKRGQAIVAQVQLGEAGQGGDRVRERLQLVIMEVENLEAEQVGDLKQEYLSVLINLALFIFLFT